MGMAGKKLKRWFSVKGEPGDRTLNQQLTGLGALVDGVKGKTVLDVGCAEGLLSLHLFDRGAEYVHGLEVVPEHVQIARKLAGFRNVAFMEGDADAFTLAPGMQYDIVIMLAVLQKLKDPSAAAEKFARTAREMVVLRLPPRGENPLVVVDERSGNKPHNITDAMHRAGFMLKCALRGYLDEHITYWERVTP